MEIRELDGNTFARILQGGAREIRMNIKTINDLNVFPVPDGDTGTNMSKTIESGIARICGEEKLPLCRVADDFAKGMLLGARGNSGVILSQFFAGMCNALVGKETVTPKELADAYSHGVKRSYEAVARPVEGTILTVFRESTEYASEHIEECVTLEDFLRLNIEEAERSLKRTKELLPVLAEADVVDSGGAGYLCIAKGMYDSLVGTEDKTWTLDIPELPHGDHTERDENVNYDLFGSDDILEYGYCTECLVRLQNAKTSIALFDEKGLALKLEAMGCDSIVSLKDGDVLKVHAHTKLPSDVLSLCQQYGEFLNVKIENMSLQHSQKLAKTEPRKPHKTYGVVTVATGEGITALFESLGADIVIQGGQTGNPSAEQFILAFEKLNVDNILVLPNNKNILLTAQQAAKLWNKNNVTVIPTKTISEGYSALSVFNPAVQDISDQVIDLTSAKDMVVSGEVTVAVRNSSVGGVEAKVGEYIGILDGELVISKENPLDVLIGMIESIEDIEDREIITLFVGAGVSDESRVTVTEGLEERFENHAVEVYIGGQEIYEYLIAVE